MGGLWLRQPDGQLPDLRRVPICLGHQRHNLPPPGRRACHATVYTRCDCHLAAGEWLDR